MRIAFAGFRHGHIMGLYKLASLHEDVQVVAAAEDDAATRSQLLEKQQAQLTHESWQRMLEEVDCDAVAIGDYYARRGEIAIAALQAGRHVISDKPLCTSLAQWQEIADLAEENDLSVGCQLDLRNRGSFRTVRRLIAEGRIGECQTVLFTGQHPLLYGSRPGWYFQEGKHGGTINDIAIHAVDCIPWMTGRQFVEVTAARVWNARPEVCPFFQDGAQMMLLMDNDGGVMGDVSYLAPDAAGYKMPQYWRLTFHGTEGVIEISMADPAVSVCGAGDKELQRIEPDEAFADGYFESFLREVGGASGELSPSTQDVLEATRITLTIQQAADENRTNVPL